GQRRGMTQGSGAHAVSQLRTVDDMHTRVRRLPLPPKPLLDYRLGCRVEGLINEYVERARVLRGGEIVEIESMTEVEELEFPPPFGKMEAFQTSGGTSTLPDTYLGRVRELDYKMIRYPGHCAKFKAMIDLGHCS